MSEITNDDSRARRLAKENSDDDDDDDCGSNHSELYGTFTWKIEKFSEISKPEIRSNVFEVGGYKWYILAYPRGCDVSDYLSLFLCVANYDKLHPGWSRFAQFTLAVMNLDIPKSKNSDTLHRFWKKEHDWGWKKFIELPEVHSKFIDDSGSLTIKVQVQLIRESVHRPFRCLDSQYRRELVRIYLSNVEQIFLRFMEEKRNKLIGDKTRWTSLCGFWLGMDQNTKQEMCREKMDVILKLVVKHFFINNEVTSTLVMDFLFCGLNALEGKTKEERMIHIKISKLVLKHLLIDEEVASPLVKDSLDSRLKTLDEETKKERATDHAQKLPALVHVDKDMFVLADDMMLRIEKAVLEPLPERDPQNYMMVGNNVELQEKRLSEFGRRTLEVFVLDHIFCNKIEVAYKEAIALERQEELIGEE